ncbi:hypothetical protein V1523DRAFT_355260 [Lipomyces doorenjongii]
MRAFFLTLTAGLFIVFTVVTYTSFNSRAGNYLGIHGASSMKSSSTLALNAWNESLGFGDVLYISMPYRTDRQDAMNLVASMSGIKLRLVEGVDGESINLKAIPDNANPNLRASELGCWRAHANAWRFVIENNLETALILEDDIDWDKNIHQIFQDLSIQMQNSTLRLASPTDHERASAPYGLDWDVLVMGQCVDKAHPEHHDLVLVYDDPNVPSREDTEFVFLNVMESLGVSGDDVGKKRLLYPAFGPACTMGYAVTRKGAQRLLLNLSYLDLRAPVDLDIAWTLRDGKVRGYTVTPPLFTPWRVGGQKDSDNMPDPDQSIVGNGNIGGVSGNIKNSARVAMVDELAMDNWGDYANQGTVQSKKKANN